MIVFATQTITYRYYLIYFYQIIICRCDDEVEEYIDVTDYEEYEWAGQSRVRVSSLLPGGGLAGSGFLTIQRTAEDEELDVTGDGAEEDYGPDQYTDNSLLQASVASALRDEVTLDPQLSIPSLCKGLNPEHSNAIHVTVKDISKSLNGSEQERNALAESCSENESRLRQEIAGLRGEMREMADMSTCRVCMDKYTRHVVSTACWHVHCESCWLLTLASKETIKLLLLKFYKKKSLYKI